MTALVLIALLLTANTGFTGDRELEAHTVDQAAVDSKLKAIRSLQTLVAQRRGTSQEPNLLISLAELQHDCANMEFRIAHANVLMKKAQTVDLRNYNFLLSQTIAVLSRFIKTYPTDSKVPRAHYLRGKALLEINRLQEATEDLKQAVERFPGNPDMKFADVALIDLLMQRKDYTGALHYVSLLHATPSDRVNYPISLDRSAWAYYYLNDLSMALKSLETEARYLKSIATSKEARADKERTINGISLFYFTGMEHKQEGFTPQNAFNYFRSIAQGDGAGSMAVQLAYLMRSKGLDEDLETLKKSLNAAGQTEEEAKLDLTLVVFESQVNQHRFTQSEETVGELDQWLTRHPAPSARRDHALKTINEAISSLQAAFTANKDNPAVYPIVTNLSALYSLMLKVPNPDRKGAPDRDMRLHFNIAELSFAMKDFEKAVSHYRWVVEHPAGHNPAEQALVSDCALKAISSKYEQMNAKGLFPKNLQAKSLSSSTTAHQIPNDIQLWVKWVDEFMGTRSDPTHKNGEVFQFEADRLLYSQGFVSDATARMLSKIGKYEDQRFAAPSASLVLDTYVTSEEWQKTYDTARQLASLRAWSPEFQTTLRGIQGDAFYKLLEIQYQKKNYPAVLDGAEKFMTENPENRNRDNCVLLAANSALALNDKGRALGYFGKLHVVTPELKPQIVLIELAMSEQKYDFSSAVNSLIHYLSLPIRDMAQTDLPSLRKKAALYEFLKSQSSLVSPRLKGSGICVDDTKAYCEHLDAIVQLISKEIPNRKYAAIAASKALQAGADGAIWGIIALRNPKALGSRERDRVLLSLSSHWDSFNKSEDAIAKFLMIPYLPPVVLEAVKLARQEVAASAHVKQIRKDTLKKRIQMLTDLERLCAQPMKMPWASVRIGALGELGQAYAEFASEIRKIPAPRGLAGQDLLDYQNSLAQMIEPLEQKSQSFTKQASDLIASYAPELDNDSFSKLLSHFEETQAHASKGSPSVISLWGNAVRERNWTKVAFFMSQLKSSGALNAQDYSLAEGISIYAAGGKAEGLLEIRDPQNKIGQRVTASAAPQAQGVPQ